MCCERVVPYMHVDTRRPRVLLHPCRNDVAGPGLIKGMKQSFLKPFAHTCPLAKMSPITATAREFPLPASRARPLCLVSSRCVLHLHVTRRRELAYPQRKVDPFAQKNSEFLFSPTPFLSRLLVQKNLDIASFRGTNCRQFLGARGTVSRAGLDKQADGSAAPSP